MNRSIALHAPHQTPSRPRPVGLILTWLARNQARKDLARLDAHLLHDIGIDAWEAAGEAAKPFWRA